VSIWDIWLGIGRLVLPAILAAGALAWVLWIATRIVRGATRVNLWRKRRAAHKRAAA
jgi:hypothetical protein